MGLDIRSARRALRSAGGRSCALYWPLDRERRARLLLRRRLAVLEAKNAIAGFLFQAQRPLAELHLHTVDQVERALADPQKGRLVVAVSVSREVIEEEMRRRVGAELGRTLDEALSELVREKVLLRVPGKGVLSSDVYLAVYRGGPAPHYDVSELTRLVHEGADYGAQLRARARRERSSALGRSYRL